MASWMVHLRIADQLLDCLPGLSAVDFVVGNIAPDAFDNRRQYITAFYLEENGHLDREYPYLSEAQMDRFVSDASAGILSRLRSECGICSQSCNSCKSCEEIAPCLTKGAVFYIILG